jgi:hypothetical protein
MRFLRRRELRLDLSAAEVSTCCIQDPLGFAPSISGRLIDVSRGGAAILLDAESAAALDTRHELLVTAGLPRTGARLKRVARVASRREDRGGVVIGLQWCEVESNDRYGQLQQARFEALLCALTESVPRRAGATGDLLARLGQVS